MLISYLTVVSLLLCSHSLQPSLAVSSINGGDISQPTRYCDYETFSARCDATDEVVHVHSAIYGRRSTGRCLEPSKVIDAFRQDERYYGCYADVLSIADRKCSGRHQCVIGLPDPDFERVTPCYEDSRKYLEIGYTCEKVVEADRSCVVEVSTSAVHISSRQLWTTSTDGHCGSVNQPWTLRAPTGQHIRVHLLDFAADITSQNTQQQQSDDDADDDDESSCREYGYVDETLTSAAAARRQQTVICGDHRRNKLVIESNSNVIHIVFNRPVTNITDFNFLLRFYAVGCLDVRPPADAWMRRVDSDMVEIGCYMSRQVWVLRCVDNQFVGVIGNCTQHLKNEEYSDKLHSQQQPSESNFVNVLTLVAVSAAGLALCMSIVCIGLLCLRRQSKNNESVSKYERVGHNGTLSRFQPSINNTNQLVDTACLHNSQASI